MASSSGSSNTNGKESRGNSGSNSYYKDYMGKNAALVSSIKEHERRRDEAIERQKIVNELLKKNMQELAKKKTEELAKKAASKNADSTKSGLASNVKRKPCFLCMAD